MAIRYTDDPARVVTKRERPQDKKLTYFVESKYINDKGQKRRKLFKVKEGKRAAEAIVEAHNRDVSDEMRLPEFGPVPCSLVFQAFTVSKKNEVAVSTMDGYQSVIKNQLTPLLGDTDFRQLSRKRVTAFIVDCFERGWAVNTIKNAVVLLSTICQEHIDDEEVETLIGRNPARNGLKRILKIAEQFEEQGVKRVDAFTRTEAAQILAIAQQYEPDAYPVIMTAFNTGMRRGELLALRWEDIAQDSITVSRALVKGRIKSPKSGKMRQVALSPALKQLFKKMRRDRKTKEGLRDPGYVFTTKTGCRWVPNNFSNAWRRVRRRAVDQADEDYPVRPLAFHCTRHTFASWALNANKPIIWVQHQMGHAKASTTLDIYAHFIPSETENLDFLTLDMPEKRPNRASGDLRVI